MPQIIRKDAIQEKQAYADPGYRPLPKPNDIPT